MGAGGYFLFFHNLLPINKPGVGDCTIDRAACRRAVLEIDTISARDLNQAIVQNDTIRVVIHKNAVIYWLE